jgi:hypothetical protein
MLNARIGIDTSGSPYKVNRKRSTILDPFFPGKNDWFVFCERMDQMLRSYEEIKAVWMILGVLSTVLLLGIVVGIIVSFVLLKDDQKDLLGTVAGCLFAALFVVFAGYFFFMNQWVVKPLNEFADKVNNYCAEIAEKNDNKVEFRFETSRKCTIFWDSDFKAWIDVTSSEPVDLTP